MAAPTSCINSEVIKTPLFPDTIMIREALCGFSKRGPTNITVFWPLEFRRGEFSLPLCQKTISILLKNHPNLQTSFQVQESVVKWFRLDPPHVPITEYQDDGTPNFWRSMVKSEVRKPFDDPSLPAWRVAVARGNEKKLLVAITILHALGDGVCLGQLAVQFNETMARLIAGMNPILPSPGEYPSLETLYQKYPSTALTTKSPTTPPLTFHPCQTGFAKRLFSKSPDLVENLSRFCKQQCPPIKIHSTLVAALILAVKKVVNPSFKTLDALTIVSFRDALGVPKSQFRPLFSWLKVEEVDPTQSFQEIALFVHKKLHAQLDAGQHVENLRTTEVQLALNPTAEELISQIQVPPNLVNVTEQARIGIQRKLS